MLIAKLVGITRADSGDLLPTRRKGFSGIVRIAQKKRREQIEQNRRIEKQKAKRRKVTALHSFDDLENLTSDEFEVYVGIIFEKMGCSVVHTGKSGDGGVDLIVEKGGVRGIVQCKHYHPTNTNVGAPHVRNLRGAMAREGITVGFLVTTSIFTEPAIREAAASGIRLIDGKGLKRLSDKHGL